MRSFLFNSIFIFSGIIYVWKNLLFYYLVNNSGRNPQIISWKWINKIKKIHRFNSFPIQLNVDEFLCIFPFQIFCDKMKKAMYAFDFVSNTILFNYSLKPGICNVFTCKRYWFLRVNLWGICFASLTLA